MAIKKENLNNFLPDGFETLNQEGYKENFSADKISTGYEKDVPEIVSGPNLNNLIDVIGKNTNTLNSYVEYLNSLSVNKTPIVDSNNQLNSTQIGLKVYSATETYLLNDLVTTIKDGRVRFYRSLVANNKGHDLTDEQYWEEVNLGGSSRNVARNVGEIISSTLPLTDAGLHLLDGALIQGDGIYKGFVDYIAKLYAKSSKKSNVTKKGSLTDNNGVLSGFSTSNYAKFPNNFQPSSNPWEMVFKVKTGATLTGSQYIVAICKGFTNETRYGTRIYLQESHFRITVSYNGTAWDITGESSVGTHTVQPNTDYYVKLQYTGSAYILSYSLDGETYIEDINKTSSTPIYNGNTACLIGIWNNGSYVDPWLNSIDLRESYININGQRWWDGRQTAGFVTEDEWQQSVTDYGVCGKFVYDSTNNTVRLPKITGILEGTTDASALGDLVEAGLPNITGSFNATQLTDLGKVVTGAFIDGGADGRSTPTSGQDGSQDGFSFDASRSNPIYGNSSTVQPQSVKVLYYIVVATSTKTDIQVDIDEIATDLNGKADVDLTNCTKPHIVETYVNGTSWYRVYSDGWCEQGGYITGNGDTSGNTHQQITFIKTFKDVNYYLNGSSMTGGVSHNYIQWCGEEKRTANSVTYYGSVNRYWYACGYIN